MMVQEKVAKTDTEVQQEIANLIAIKPRIPQFSAFGDNNHAAIDAQLAVLRERLTRDEVVTRFPFDGTETNYMARVAYEWMSGEVPAGPNDTPSQDWQAIAR